MKLLRRLKVSLLHTKYKMSKITSPSQNVLLYYDIRNWGDQLNVKLAKKMNMNVGFLDIDVRKKIHASEESYTPLTEILMIGSIAHHCSNISEIYGSGVIDPKIKLQFKPRIIHALRGPLTRSYFLSHDVSCPEVYGDPALLMPRYFDVKTPKKYSVGVIMHNDHHKSFSIKGDNIRMISLRWGFHKVLEEILSCEKIISSSLHGLIVSDAYGIPNLRLITDNPLHGGDFKFDDYYMSLGISDHDRVHISQIHNETDIIKRCVAKEVSLDLDLLNNLCPK